MCSAHESQRGHQIPWSCWHGCWELNYPAEGQQVFLAAEPSFQLLDFCFLRQDLTTKPCWGETICTFNSARPPPFFALMFPVQSLKVIFDFCTAGYKCNCPSSILLLTVQWEITDFGLEKQCLGLETSKELWSPFLGGIQTHQMKGSIVSSREPNRAADTYQQGVSTVICSRQHLFNYQRGLCPLTALFFFFDKSLKSEGSEVCLCISVSMYLPPYLFMWRQALTIQLWLAWNITHRTSWPWTVGYPASASWVLGLQVRSVAPGFLLFLSLFMFLCNILVVAFVVLFLAWR